MSKALNSISQHIFIHSKHTIACKCRRHHIIFIVHVNHMTNQSMFIVHVHEQLVLITCLYR